MKKKTNIFFFSFTIVNSIQRHWQCLRDKFCAEYKKIPRDVEGDLLMQVEDFNSKWPYYRQSLFLGKKK